MASNWIASPWSCQGDGNYYNDDDNDDTSMPMPMPIPDADTGAHPDAKSIFYFTLQCIWKSSQKEHLNTKSSQFK